MSLDELIASLKTMPLLGIFSEQALNFIQQLSKHLLKDARCKQYPELVALGFWLRQSNLKKLTIQQGFNSVFELADSETAEPSREPVGLAVHFTPANVDTMFIYSWVAALLLGNCNIVRVSSKESEQQNLLLTIISQLFSAADHLDIAKRNYFITYSTQGEETSILCANADARLIWGGDKSVSTILSYRAPEACVDLCFADKFSASILVNIGERNLNKAAQLLWRDTQPYLQQACSSPRIIYCVNDRKEDKAQVIALLSELNNFAKHHTQSGWYSVSQANEHLVTAQQIMAEQTCGSTDLLTHASVAGLLVSDINDGMLELHSGNGFFICKMCSNLEEVFIDIAKLNNEKLQTLSFYNSSIDELAQQKELKSIKGIDRIVPLGQALDFSFHWDGYDLLRELSYATNLECEMDERL
jgi:hypothetical protein